MRPRERPQPHGGHTRPSAPSTPPRQPYGAQGSGDAPMATIRGLGDRPCPRGCHTVPRVPTTPPRRPYVAQRTGHAPTAANKAQGVGHTPTVHRTIFLPVESTDAFSIFIAWLNLDFGIETCFYDGMDAYSKTWLQFVFPLYIWVSRTDDSC